MVFGGFLRWLFRNKLVIVKDFIEEIDRDLSGQPPYNMYYIMNEDNMDYDLDYK